MAQDISITSKSYFYNLTVLYASLIIGQILFAGIAYFLNSNGSAGSEGGDLHEIFQLIIPIAVIGGLSGSILLTRKRLQEIKEKTNLAEKLLDYRSTLILKYALLEGPSLIAIIGYLLTGRLYFLGFAAIIIGAFLLNRPTVDSAANDLELSARERELLEDPEAIVIE